MTAGFANLSLEARRAFILGQLSEAATNRRCWRSRELEAKARVTEIDEFIASAQKQLDAVEAVIAAQDNCVADPTYRLPEIPK